MDNHQHEHGGENRRVVGPYIPPKRKKRRSYRGLLVFLCVLAVFAILGSAGAIYWKVFVKPPEAAAPEDDGTADTPVVIENNLPANLDAEDLTE